MRRSDVSIDKPSMPIAQLIREAIRDSDYSDGDNPGWFSGSWDEANGELTIKYEADEDCDPKYLGPYRSTVRVFRAVES